MNPAPAKLLSLLERLKGRRVLVVGDLILDEFVWGEVERISPEAPVPVVQVRAESWMPGGAANVANNLSALGVQAIMAGVVGDDRAGGILTDELRKRRIDLAAVQVDRKRPTTVKTRVIAHHQQVVRIDREETAAIQAGVMERVLRVIEKLLPSVEAIIIEDYGKGVIQPLLLRTLVPLAHRHHRITVVDPKEDHFDLYTGVTSLTPNRREAATASGLAITDAKSFRRAGEALRERLKAKTVLVTLGEDGMALFEPRRMTHIPTVAQEIFDVAGAGDTVVAVFTAALAAEADALAAATLANYAAGIVVGKVGTAVVTPQELAARLQEKRAAPTARRTRHAGDRRHSRPVRVQPVSR